MSKKYTLLIGLIIAIIVVVLLVYKGNYGQQPIASETPSTSVTVSESPAPTSVNGSSAPFIGLTGLKSPATCKLEGELVFIAPNISENHNARISWNNVDIASRNITWTITPKADLGVGPNLFANLKLPSGSESITVRLPDDSKSSYKLRAAVGYGEVVNGNVVVKNATCSGEVTVRKAF